jgi:hypothetical protein
MSSNAQILAELPGYVLGLGAQKTTPEEVRDRLAAIGQADPERGHSLADELMRCALQLIADGHPTAATLARDTLTVISAEFPRWTA